MAIEFSPVNRFMGNANTTSLNFGNFTTGCRFQVKTATTVNGVRFYWPGEPNQQSRTVRCSIWRDSTSVRLATVDLTVTTKGVYVARFATPLALSGGNVNADLIVGCWVTAGDLYMKVDDIYLTGGMLPMVYEDVLLKENKLFTAGDVKPASVAGSERYTLMEPFF